VNQALTMIISMEIVARPQLLHHDAKARAARGPYTITGIAGRVCDPDFAA